MPAVVQAALAATTDTPGYPATYGTPALRAAAAGWLRRRHGVASADPANVLPLIGAKEFVAWLPTLLGLGAGDVVGVPALAYPTYAVGAQLAGAQSLVVDGTVSVGPAPMAMLWVNSPANPHGQVLGVDHLRKLVEWARERGTIVVSDECYLEFGWDGRAAACRSCIPMSAATRMPDCSPSTRCRSVRTWPAIGPASSPATARWSPSCSRHASTPG